MHQFRLALIQRGLFSSVLGVLDRIPELKKSEMQVEWDFSENVDPNHPVFMLLSEAVDLSPEQGLELFKDAAGL